MILFKQALSCSVARMRKARRVKQPEHYREIRKQSVIENAVKIEFDVALLDQTRTVTEQADNAAVRDNAV